MEVLPLLGTEAGFRRAQVCPVGLCLESVGRDGDAALFDALACGLAQQVLDHPLTVVVLAFAEVVVADPALRICEVKAAGQYRLAKAFQTL